MCQFDTFLIFKSKRKLPPASFLSALLSPTIGEDPRGEETMAVVNKMRGIPKEPSIHRVGFVDFS